MGIRELPAMTAEKPAAAHADPPVYGTGPYREAEQPARSRSNLGLVVVKEYVDHQVRCVRETDSLMTALGTAAVYTAGMVTLTAVAGITGAAMAAIFILKHRMTNIPGVMSKAAYGLTEIFYDVFQENITPYRHRLESMLERCDVVHETFTDVPKEYVDPLLLDYAITQHSEWEERDAAGMRSAVAAQAIPIGAGPGSTDRTYRDEALAAANRMSKRAALAFASYVLERRDYETLHRLGKVFDDKMATSPFEILVDEHIDDTLESGSEGQLYDIAQYLADTGLWANLRDVYDIFEDDTQEGEEFEQDALDIAISISPVDGEDQDLEISPGALVVLFDYYLDHGMTEKADEVIDYMDGKRQKWYGRELESYIKGQEELESEAAEDDLEAA